MNLYEHTIIARQDISPSQIKSLKEKYSKLIEENKGNLVQTRGEKIVFKDCTLLQQEDTRLSNPACNLRGTGWNRWEWLCHDPQERVLMPFDYHINTNILERDNHRPCVPEPMDQTMSLPVPNNEPIRNEIVATRAVPTGPPSVQWQQRERIEKY